MLGMLAGLIAECYQLEEYYGLDFLFTIRGSRAASPDVVIVNMDKPAKDKFFPPSSTEKFHRSVYADLIDRLHKEGAAAIAFDIIFPEAGIPENDRRLAQAISKAEKVVLCGKIERGHYPLSEESEQLHELNIERHVLPAELFSKAAPALATFPLPKLPVKLSQCWLFKTSAGDTPTIPIVMLQLFFLHIYPDFRSLLEAVEPSAAKILPADKQTIIENKRIIDIILRIRNQFKRRPFLANKLQEALQNSGLKDKYPQKGEALETLIDMYGSSDCMYLNFFGPPGSVTTIPYHEVLNPEKDLNGRNNSGRFEGKAVFIGFSELSRSEQKDNFFTVFSRSDGTDISGVEIAATAFANLLENRPVQPFTIRMLLVIAVVWGGLIGVVSRVFSPRIAWVIICVLGVCYWFGTQHQFNHSAKWYPIVTPLFIQMPLVVIGSLVWNYVESNKRYHNVKHAFGLYLPDRVVSRLAQDMSGFTSDSKIMYGICLFTDAEHYTTLSETMTPEALGELLNQYYKILFQPVKKHHGNVSDIVGDAMFAIWANGHDDHKLRSQACQAALEIATAVDRFNSCGEFPKLPTRIGLHSGKVLLGNIGAMDHYEYTSVGDVVNTASRVEGLNKHLGTRIIVTGDVLRHIDGFLIRNLGHFILSGKMKSISAYELICRIEHATEEQNAICETFSEALHVFKQCHFPEAIELFNTVTKIRPEDGPALFYRSQCQHYMIHKPDQFWDGAISFKQK